MVNDELERMWMEAAVGVPTEIPAGISWMQVRSGNVWAPGRYLPNCSQKRYCLICGRDSGRVSPECKPESLLFDLRPRFRAGVSWMQARRVTVWFAAEIPGGHLLNASQNRYCLIDGRDFGRASPECKPEALLFDPRPRFQVGISWMQARSANVWAPGGHLLNVSQKRYYLSPGQASPESKPEALLFELRPRYQRKFSECKPEAIPFEPVCLVLEENAHCLMLNKLYTWCEVSR
jgi:hypothetical protein